MLSRSHRLPKEEIREVLRRGIRVKNDVVEFIYKKTTGTPRFAFIVSTKIDKRATHRNRMRRVMSESVRHLLPRLQSLDGIFIAKKNFADKPQADVEKIIRTLVQV